MKSAMSKENIQKCRNEKEAKWKVGPAPSVLMFLLKNKIIFYELVTLWRGVWVEREWESRGIDDADENHNGLNTCDSYDHGRTR